MTNYLLKNCQAKLDKYSYEENNFSQRLEISNRFEFTSGLM